MTHGIKRLYPGTWEYEFVDEMRCTDDPLAVVRKRYLERYPQASDRLITSIVHQEKLPINRRIKRGGGPHRYIRQSYLNGFTPAEIGYIFRQSTNRTKMIAETPLTEKGPLL